MEALDDLLSDSDYERGEPWLKGPRQQYGCKAGDLETVEEPADYDSMMHDEDFDDEARQRAKIWDLSSLGLGPARSMQAAKPETNSLKSGARFDVSALSRMLDLSEKAGLEATDFPVEESTGITSDSDDNGCSGFDAPIGELSRDAHTPPCSTKHAPHASASVPTTADGGRSPSPESELGTGFEKDDSPRRTPERVRGAELVRSLLEEELNTKSALINDFSGPAGGKTKGEHVGTGMTSATPDCSPVCDVTISPVCDVTIETTGRYDDSSASTASKEGTPAAPACTGVGVARAKPFLKKGARMQRSCPPPRSTNKGFSNASTRADSRSKGLQLRPRPQSAAAAEKQLQIQARSTQPTEIQDELHENAWDCRAIGLDLELDMVDLPPNEQDFAALAEAPTSPLVSSYFHATAPKVANASRDDPAELREHCDDVERRENRSRLAVMRDPNNSMDTYARGASRASNRGAQSSDAMLDEVVSMADLDEQIKKYQHEARRLKQLQSQAEQAERDVAREREQLRAEVRTEREALHAEFDSEQAALKRERRRLAENADRQRQQFKDDRDALEEKRQLRERIEQLQEEQCEKDKRWQRTVDRLQRQVNDLTKKNQELEVEVRRLGQQAQQRSASRPSATARSGQPVVPVLKGIQRVNSFGSLQRPSTQHEQEQATIEVPQSKGEAWGPRLSDGRVVADRYGRVVAPRGEVVNHSHQSSNSASASKSKVPQELSEKAESRLVDERTETNFKDGRREILFPNGLRKVFYPDGRLQVLFQNGDKKEVKEDGTVVYSYGTTGAVQTTLPDGCELYRFADGQTETHHPDGSQEIRFPNGTIKAVDQEGNEVVTFPDGTKQHKTSASRKLAGV